MTIQKAKSRLIYINEKLRIRMSQLDQFPCTLIEAPIGYGKTTVVNEFFKNTAIKVIWQKIYDRSNPRFWSGFCHAILEIDKECRQSLENIQVLEENLIKRELMLLLENLMISETTFLVIDDYHNVKTPAADEFLFTLLKNMPENLHLILITREAFLGNTREMQLKGMINHICTNDLAFSLSDIQSYYRLLGINAGKEQLELLYAYSEGWISALYLCAMDYMLHGEFLFTRDVPELVYQTVYEPLGDECKLLLSYLCHFEVFSLKQAEYLWQRNNTQELINYLLNTNAFITKDAVSGSYSMHNILGLCVREQFLQLPDEIQQTIWKRTGDMYLDANQHLLAMECYHKAGYNEGVMLTMEGGKLALTLLNQHKELFILCYSDCPLEVKVRHPRAILFYAAQFMTQFMEIEIYESACRDFQISMEKNSTLKEEERSQLLGEYEIIRMFTTFNDIIEMSRCNERAARLLQAPSDFYDNRDRFMFGSPSLLYLYYREAGKMEELIEFIRSTPGYYSQNTRGHGQGYRPLFEAEWMYYTGDFDNAEIMLHKGINQADSDQQMDIELVGLFLLARLALYRGNYHKLQEILGEMERLVRREITQYQAYWMVYTLDLCKAYIYSCLEKPELIPEWIFEYEYPKHMQFLSIAYANLVYGKALLLTGENAKLLGLSETFLQQAGIFPNLLGTIHTYIYTAIAAFRMNRLGECRDSITKALDLAMPDGIRMPFVENAKELLPVFELLSGEMEYGLFIARIKKIYQFYGRSVLLMIENNLSEEKPRLSAREKQISLLVVEGMSNKEIAQALHISQDTVKLELKNIFRKLNIDSRVLLRKEMIV